MQAECLQTTKKIISKPLCLRVILIGNERTHQILYREITFY